MVFDVGGYEGQWSSDIFSKYVCHIHIFEPVPEYADQIASRMLNDLVKLHPDAEQRLKEIQRGLRRTHQLRYCYPYVWEGWSRVGSQ
jgi:hypothetical protein